MWQFSVSQMMARLILPGGSWLAIHSSPQADSFQGHAKRHQHVSRSNRSNHLHYLVLALAIVARGLVACTETISLVYMDVSTERRCLSSAIKARHHIKGTDPLCTRFPASINFLRSTKSHDGKFDGFERETLLYEKTIYPLCVFLRDTAMDSLAVSQRHKLIVLFQLPVWITCY